MLTWKELFAAAPIFVGVIAATYTALLVWPSAEIAVLALECKRDSVYLMAANSGDRAGILSVEGFTLDGKKVRNVKVKNNPAVVFLAPGETQSITGEFFIEEVSVKSTRLGDTFTANSLCALKLGTGRKSNWLSYEDRRCSCPS
ncbi:hypothetical protein AB9F35_00065 [Rhizobium leguminosarum]|uniref:hypothetical protein n=1 Tax=Rhizobium leguminosarum TaxID=384 RepID=UPI003F99C252